MVTIIFGQIDDLGSVPKQNDRLLKHDTRTSNTVKAYHRVIYRII